MLVFAAGTHHAFAQAADTADATNAADAGVRDPCPPSLAPVALGTAEWNGWGRDLQNSRYQPEPALRAIDVPKLALKWAYGLSPAAHYGQPTVVGGRLFVTSSSGRVYSLDSTTGCTNWIFDAAADAGTSIVVGALGHPKVVERRARRSWRRKWRRRWHRYAYRWRTNAHIEVIEPPSAVFFGDHQGNVYALDAEKGGLLWKTPIGSAAAARVTGPPTLYGDRLYVPLATEEPPAAPNPATACCVLHYSVAALDIATGALLWRTEIPGAQSVAPPAALASMPVGGAPTVDPKRGVIYLAAASSAAIVALNLDDGKQRWLRALAGSGPARTQRVFGNSPILQTLANGRQVLLTGEQGGVVFSLDPDRDGALLWRTRVLRGGVGGGVEWSPAADHRKVYVAVADPAPGARDDRGALAALDIASGEMRWIMPSPSPKCASVDPACARNHAQAVTVMPGIVFCGSIDGHLRAYSTIDGLQVWDFDTEREFTTVNGLPARGSTLGGGGATIVGGMVYINSGNDTEKGGPGNVLLAFSVDGK